MHKGPFGSGVTWRKSFRILIEAGDIPPEKPTTESRRHGERQRPSAADLRRSGADQQRSTTKLSTKKLSATERTEEIAEDEPAGRRGVGVGSGGRMSCFTGFQILKQARVAPKALFGTLWTTNGR